MQNFSKSFILYAAILMYCTLFSVHYVKICKYIKCTQNVMGMQHLHTKRDNLVKKKLKHKQWASEIQEKIVERERFSLNKTYVFHIISFCFLSCSLFYVACAFVICLIKYLLTYLLSYVIVLFSFDLSFIYDVMQDKQTSGWRIWSVTTGLV